LKIPEGFRIDYLPVVLETGGVTVSWSLSTFIYVLYPLYGFSKSIYINQKEEFPNSRILNKIGSLNINGNL